MRVHLGQVEFKVPRACGYCVLLAVGSEERCGMETEVFENCHMLKPKTRVIEGRVSRESKKRKGKNGHQDRG